MNPFTPTVLNDVHSQLNTTRVAGVLTPTTSDEIRAALQTAVMANLAVSVCGCRHAMGGQQFGEDTLLLDLSRLTEIGPVDRVRGLVEAGAGVTWSQLISSLQAQQSGTDLIWSIRQKQTGADRLTLGGALAANAHGRGLQLRPLIADVEAFTLILASGTMLRCSREQNPELFRLVIGGYGCFGIVISVCLRLVPRQRLERVVELITLDRLMIALEERIRSGYLYGDFQFAIDPDSPDFLHRGVFSCYRPAAVSHADSATHQELAPADWEQLLYLAHTEPTRAFEAYATHYLATNGQLYWSDTHQLTVYLDDYHTKLDRLLGATVKGSEMITELYVPRGRLTDFMTRAAHLLRSHGVPVIYGTIRLIERDTESFLAWARADFACIIFNLHVDHTAAGVARAAAAFRALIDIALSLGGSYFLTYHRWATRAQVAAAYPQFPEFLRLKESYDPQHRLQSDWWRHHRTLFASAQTRPARDFSVAPLG